MIKEGKSSNDGINNKNTVELIMEEEKHSINENGIYNSHDYDDDDDDDDDLDQQRQSSSSSP